MDNQQFYGSRSENLSQRIGMLKARTRSFVMGLVLTFLAAVACVVCITLTEDGIWRMVALVAAIACLAAYVVVRRYDTANDNRIQRLEDLKQVYDNELHAQQGNFACFDDGQRYVAPHHAYTFDLDVFGPGSLYQRMGRMVTTGGCDSMAERLCSMDGRSASPIVRGCSQETYAAYHAHIEQLSVEEGFRSSFMAYGVREKIDTEAIRRALRAAGEVRVPAWFASPLALCLAMAGLVGFLACVVLAVLGIVDGMLPLWWGVLQFFAVYVLCMRVLKDVGVAIGRLNVQVRRLAGVVRLMEGCHTSVAYGGPEAPVCTWKQHRGSVEDVFSRLTALLDGLDKRGNIMGLLLVDTLALYDFFLVRKFVRWTRHDVREFEAWIDRVVAMDQDVSAATFLYNHPDTCWAEVTDDATVTYEAHGLYHPFLGARAVRNDFGIDHRHFYIVTGANMAGKSTFLRSLGVNYVLALLGMPVFAHSMRVSRFKIFSSMRTSDDLTHGISYFNAELLRLRQLMGTLSQPGTGQLPSLIILDEILKGTNSLDKLNGSRLFLQHVSQLNVSGIVATHDLELSKMEGERYHNYCFEIEIGTDVAYSYKITRGVARNQNATFLLNQMLREQEV